jgi:hypothetical protein
MYGNTTNANVKFSDKMESGTFSSLGVFHSFLLVLMSHLFIEFGVSKFCSWIGHYYTTNFVLHCDYNSQVSEALAFYPF